MILVAAGSAPHTITRPCQNAEEARRVAEALAARGVTPITIGGVLFDPNAPDPDGEPPDREG